MSVLVAVLATLAVLGTVAFTVWRSWRRPVNDLPPSEAERLASWEIRRGRWLAEQRLRAERVKQQFDACCSVQPKITPRIPQ